MPARTSAPTPARTVALEALRGVRSGALAGSAFEAAAARLDPRDRAWSQELVFGTLRLRARLDHRLAPLSTRPLDRVDPDVLDILRLGAYQLTEMGGVPAYAATSQSVDLAKSIGSRSAAGFVNGVLQSLRRAGPASTFPAFEADPAAHLTTWGSHPGWLVQRWIARYGTDGALRLVEANNTRPELYLRALGDVPRVVELLDAAGVRVESVAGAPHSLHVVEGSVQAALAAAPVIVQDPAAGLVATYVGAPADARIVDLAAAPGGKALALAAAQPAPRIVAGADLSRSRLVRMEENIVRLARRADSAAAGAVGIVVADGRRPPFRPVDVVLLDAPCTGTGTLRRHPDGRWRVGPDDLAALASLQRMLLDAAVGAVAPGGLLAYSTCSLEPEENEEQVESFLERHREFEIERGQPPAGGTAGVVQTDGALRVLPHVHGWDGAYAVRLRRAHAG
jgi:16S rRNA (cytosine967-C5)-methyltransferase